MQSAVTIPLSSTGSFNLCNKSGTVNIIIDINGYNPKDSLAELYGNRVTAASTNVFTVAMSVTVQAHPLGRNHPDCREHVCLQPGHR